MREKDLLLLVTIVAVAFVVVFLTGGGMGFMMGPMMGGGGWMILFWILIGVGVYLLLTNYLQSKSYENDNALTIAKERYARGEITLEEYEEIKRNLSKI